MDSKKALAKNLAYIMEQSGKSRAEIAGAVGASYSTVSEWLQGKKYPRIDKVEAMAMYFGVTKSALIEDHDGISVLNDDSQVFAHRIPVLGSIRCGEPAFAEESFEGYIASNLRCDFALRAVGDSMIGARIHDGDIVFIKKLDTVEDVQIAGVILDDEATLKRVRYLPGGMTMLQAENSKYPPIIIGVEGETRTAKIIGLAVAFQSAVR